jgi:AcrR family transcriptional regulator
LGHFFCSCCYQTMKDTEQTIIDAAILIFNEDLSAPLEKVAEQAQVTRRTLHRYFKDRRELMQKCQKEIRKTCEVAMTNAYHTSENPLERLQNMFYAGLDCGSKNTFLHKLHTLHDHKHQAANEECSEYDHTFELWKGNLQVLLAKGVINQAMTVDWIHNLFQSVVAVFISSQLKGTLDRAKARELAWFSFSKGIGI